MRFLLAAARITLIRAQNPLLDDARTNYDEVKSFILRSAQKMPEENYSFRPAPRIRTFGQILGHLADEQYLFCSAAKDENRAADVEKKKTSKADLIAALNDAFAYCDSVYGSLNDQTVMEKAKNGKSRLHMLWGNTIQDNLHYGNLITYLRIKGIVPPSTEGR
jgi:uncharacterized damage-inducible protein DinB